MSRKKRSMKTNAGSPPTDPTNPPPTQPEAPAAPPSAPLSISGLGAITEDEAARFQDGAVPYDVKGDMRSVISEQEFLGACKPVQCPEGKLIATAILDLFKVSGHPVPANLALGLRELAERGYLVR